jgi:hypothetical protein
MSPGKPIKWNNWYNWYVHDAKVGGYQHSISRKIDCLDASQFAGGVQVTAGGVITSELVCISLLQDDLKDFGDKSEGAPALFVKGGKAGSLLAGEHESIKGLSASHLERKDILQEWSVKILALPDLEMVPVEIIFGLYSISIHLTSW